MRRLNPPTPLLLAVLLLPSACTQATSAPSQSTTVKVQIRFPQGTRIERVDNAAARIMATLQPLDGVQRGRLVSRPEELEVYIQMTSAQPAEKIRAALQHNPIPDTAPPEISTLAGDFPAVTPQSQPALKVDIDLAKTAALGIKPADLDAALATYRTKPPTPEGLSATLLPASDGTQVPLSTVARLTTEMRPDCIVRQWP